VIKLSTGVEQRLIGSIKRYSLEYMEEEMGELKASLLLDFCLKEIGPCFYNQAIADAQAILLDKVDDLGGACHMPEFEYWKK
jgi:uncharacterized protein (DUF2164 family)